MKKERKSNLVSLVYIAVFTAIIAICAQIQIPTAVPFTLQTLGIFLAGGLLGAKRGVLSVVIYILLGLIGIPVFSGFKGGAAVLVGVTGGYIIGFIFIALVVGISRDKFETKILPLTLSMIIGQILCYAFGTIWFMIVYNHSMGQASLVSALSMCVFPYLIFDAVKIAAAVILVNRLNKVIKV